MTYEPLDKEDVKALRQANGVIFKANSLGQGSIILIREAHTFSALEQRLFPEPREHVSELRGQERSRTILVAGAVNGASLISESYDEALTHSEERPLQGWTYIQSARYDHNWRTTASLLRPGDSLKLLFRADWHSNSLLLKVGLHADVLELQVDRPTKNRMKRMQFHVDQRVCEDNTARMVGKIGEWRHGLTQEVKDYFPEHHRVTV